MPSQSNTRLPPTPTCPTGARNSKPLVRGAVVGGGGSVNSTSALQASMRKQRAETRTFERDRGKGSQSAVKVIRGQRGGESGGGKKPSYSDSKEIGPFFFGGEEGAEKDRRRSDERTPCPVPSQQHVSDGVFAPIALIISSTPPLPLNSLAGQGLERAAAVLCGQDG